MLNKLANRPALQDWPPHGLMSLWDMYKVRIVDFIEVIETIENTSGFLKAQDQQMDSAICSIMVKRPTDTVPLSDYFKSQVEYIRILCGSISANHTRLFAEDVAKEGTSPKFTLRDAIRRVDDLMASMKRELADDHVFICMKEYARYFRDDIEDMAVAFERFPRAQVDFIEAGKCLALGRSTASVLHLMRSLEEPLVHLAQHLGVEVKDTDTWGAVITNIRGAMRLRDIGGKNVSKWSGKAEREFCHLAADCIKHIQVSTRDPGMHAQKEKFTLDEARLEYENTKRFLIQMAKGLPSSSADVKKDA